MKRINIVGTSGSGKSTFAKQLAERLAFPYVQLDQLHWKPNWEESSDEELFAKLTTALNATPTWVLDGNYSKTTFIKWPLADTVIWLDYSFARTIFQVTRRSINRAITKKELWPGTGNNESFRRMFSKESIIHWSLISYRPTKKKYTAAMNDEAYAHLRFVRLRSPNEARRFLDGLAADVKDRGVY